MVQRHAPTFGGFTGGGGSSSTVWGYVAGLSVTSGLVCGEGACPPLGCVAAPKPAISSIQKMRCLYWGCCAAQRGTSPLATDKPARHKSTFEKHADTELQESTPQQLLTSIDYFPSRSKGMLHQPNSHLLRRGRHSESGRPYLITAVVHNRQPLFKDFHLGRLLVAEFRKTHELGMVDSLAWVVMPDHFHWLFELQGTTLSQAAAPSPLIAHAAAKNDSGNLATMTEQCVAMKTFAKLPATSSPILCERAWSNILVTTHYGTQPGSDFSCVERACLWRGGLPPVGLRSSPSKHTAFLQEDLHGRFWGCCAAQRGTSPLATNSITLTNPPHSPTTV